MYDGCFKLFLNFIKKNQNILCIYEPYDGYLKFFLISTKKY